MAEFDIHAVTDITGFGLGGHALEMAEGSGVTLEIRTDDVPMMSEALENVRKRDANRCQRRQSGVD